VQLNKKKRKEKRKTYGELTIHDTYCCFGRHGACLLSCPLVVMLSPSLFHRCRCPQSTLRAGARRHGVGVIPLCCRVVPPALCPVVVLLVLVLVLAVSSPPRPVIIDRLHLQSHPMSSCLKAWGQVPCHPQQCGVGHGWRWR
jgi:hypothetical protein